MESEKVANAGSEATVHVSLAEELRALGKHFEGRPAALGDVFDALGAKASALLIVLCALPFSTPITIPGLSTPFGLVILLLASRYFMGLPPWLPERLRRVHLPSDFFNKVIAASSRLVGWLERRTCKRWVVLTDAEWKLRLHTGVVIMASMLLMLPLPPLPPFTNTLPALVAVLLTFSVMKRDGLGTLAGHGLFLFTVGYFIFWGEVIVRVFHEAYTRLMG